MKKIPAILLTILSLTLALASCNLDGTSGIFREVALSKASLSIRYKQLLGDDGTDLYFRTEKGVERVDKTTKVNTPVAMSKYEKIIQAAALNGSKVLYFTNNEVDNNPKDNMAKFNFIVTTDPNFTVTKIPVDITKTIVNSELSIKNLYANSMILVTGKDGTGKKVFEMLKYDGTNFTTSVAQFTMPNNDYDLENVIQQTAKEQNASDPMLVSFVFHDEESKVINRQHYLVDPSSLPATPKALIGFDDLTIANFMYDSTNDKLYVLSSNGDLYYAGSLASPVTKVEIGSSDKTYSANAFAYGLHDTDNNKIHFVTKPSLYNSPLYVFTLPYGAIVSTDVSLAEVKSGYAKELSLATIVSSQQKLPIVAGTTDLLVATDENGMYDISITHSVANKDIDSNGSSSTAENYSF